MLNVDRRRHRRLPARPEPARHDRRHQQVEHQADAGRTPTCPASRSPAARSSASSSSRSPVGIAYWVLLGRTRFGFDLRATGLSETAAVASGVTSSGWSIRDHAASPAGSPAWSGMPLLLGGSHTYAQDFPTGFGFAGIAIALLGRNNPIGIALGALLWSFLEQSAQILDLEGVPQGDRDDHAGRHRAVASSSPTSWCAGSRWRSSSAGSGAELRPRPPRRRRRGEPGMTATGHVRVDDQRLDGARDAAGASAGRSGCWPSPGLLVLVSIVRLDHRRQRHHLQRHLGAALRLAVPIGLAGLGGLWSERAGVVNIGLEGMMILGTWFGAWGAYEFGPWCGVLVGIIGGALGGLRPRRRHRHLRRRPHRLRCRDQHPRRRRHPVPVRADLRRTCRAAARPSRPACPAIGTVTLPGLGGAARPWRTSTGSLVSDVAGILGGLVTEVSLLTIVAVLLVPATYFVLWRTAFGLRLRSCGEARARPSRWA